MKPEVVGVAGQMWDSETGELVQETAAERNPRQQLRDTLAMLAEAKEQVDAWETIRKVASAKAAASMVDLQMTRLDDPERGVVFGFRAGRTQETATVKELDEAIAAELVDLTPAQRDALLAECVQPGARLHVPSLRAHLLALRAGAPDSHVELELASFMGETEFRQHVVVGKLAKTAPEI